MNEIQVCNRCVMDTTDPKITFDEHGVCNHCTRAEENLKKLWTPDERGLENLQKVSHQIREVGKNSEYDCIIGVSGGVDSSYLLYVAKEMMGLRPLAVHVDAGWNSELAVNNIEKLVKSLKIDLFTHVIDWEEMQDLQLSFLKASVANQDIPQDHAFFAKLYEFAIQNNIKYVLNGSNLSSECILPSSWGYDSTDKTHLTSIHKKFGKKELNSYPTMNFFKYNFYWPYIKGMTIVRPLNLLDYNKFNAMKELEDKFGWAYYGGKHYESRWTKFFQSYYLPTKFGYDKRKAHLSSVIVSGQLTREDALAELEKPPFNQDEIEEDKDFVAKKLGITTAELESLLTLPNKSYKDYPNDRWKISVLRKIVSFTQKR